MEVRGPKDEKRAGLRVAILGTRGIPARYGGFETFAEQLATRLAARGHEVTVYGRRPLLSAKPGLNEYRGVKLRFAPTVMHKYLETPLHGFFSMLDLFRQEFDVVLLCNAANSPFAWLARLRRVPLAINVDGIERKRSKWNSFGRWWYRLGERCSVWFAGRVVADAQVIADYYRQSYGCSCSVIAYGAEAVRRPAGDVLRRFNLQPGNYLLYVSRLEPENNALGVVEAYGRLQSELPLVVVGDAPYASDYIRQVKQAAGPRVIFTGYQFGEAYQELQSHCCLYVQATEVGGTHPALIEAMAYGNAIIANGTPENREVLGDTGLYYSVNDFAELAARMDQLIKDQPLRAELGAQAAKRAGEYYTWERIVDQYEGLFEELRG